MIDASVQAARVCYWIKEHQAEFNKLCALVDNAQIKGCAHITRSTAYALAEAKGIRITDGDGNETEAVTARNHNFWPCVTRFMVMLKPTRALVFEFRKSKFDDCDLVALWREIVNAKTVFLANNRTEAQFLVTCDKRGVSHVNV